jgi:hypothetical protein
MVKARAGIITDFFLRNDTALNLVINRSQWLQNAEKFFQRIFGNLLILMAAVCLCFCGSGKKGADG